MSRGCSSHVNEPLAGGLPASVVKAEFEFIGADRNSQTLLLTLIAKELWRSPVRRSTGLPIDSQKSSISRRSAPAADHESFSLNPSGVFDRGSRCGSDTETVETTKRKSAVLRCIFSFSHDF